MRHNNTRKQVGYKQNENNKTKHNQTMQKVANVGWDLFREMLFETLDEPNLENSLWHLDVFEKKVSDGE